MMTECMKWEAVYGDGQRRGIEITDDGDRFERCGGRFSARVAGFGGVLEGVTPILAAHSAVEALLLAGHDVRDLVPAGAASRADLRAEVERLKAELYLAMQSAEKHMLRANRAEQQVRDRDALLADDIETRKAVRLLLKWAQEGRE